MNNKDIHIYNIYIYYNIFYVTVYQPGTNLYLAKHGVCWFVPQTSIEKVVV